MYPVLVAKILKDLFDKRMNTIHKYHNNKIKLFLCLPVSWNKQGAVGLCFVLFFFKGAAVSLPNTAHTFNMTNQHRTAKLMTPSPSCQLAGEDGGAVTASAIRKQRVGTPGSVHPHVITKKKKNHLTYTHARYTGCKRKQKVCADMKGQIHKGRLI